MLVGLRVSSYGGQINPY